MNERYFAKRAEGDFAETQRIKAVVGHAVVVRQAFGRCLREYEVKDGRSFFRALRDLLKELGKAGHTKNEDGWHAPGGKFLPFEKLSPQQLFGTWASVQQAVAKWIWNLLPTSDLYLAVTEL